MTFAAHCDIYLSYFDANPTQRLIRYAIRHSPHVAYSRLVTYRAFECNARMQVDERALHTKPQHAAALRRVGLTGASKMNAQQAQQVSWGLSSCNMRSQSFDAVAFLCTIHNVTE